MLRNPVELINSLYSMYVGLGFEYSKNLQEALDLEEEREKGIAIKRHQSSESALFLYSKIGKLGEQLERLNNVVPRNQIKVILHDDFSSNPKLCYEEILNFLKLGNPEFERTTFPRVNAQKTAFGKDAIQYLRSNRLTRGAAKVFKDALGIKSMGFGIPKIPLSETDKLKLISLFQDDVKLLSKILDRNLEHWLSLDDIS